MLLSCFVKHYRPWSDVVAAALATKHVLPAQPRIRVVNNQGQNNVVVVVVAGVRSSC